MLMWGQVNETSCRFTLLKTRLGMVLLVRPNNEGRSRDNEITHVKLAFQYDQYSSCVIVDQGVCVAAEQSWTCGSWTCPGPGSGFIIYTQNQWKNSSLVWSWFWILDLILIFKVKLNRNLYVSSWFWFGVLTTYFWYWMWCLELK